MYAKVFSQMYDGSLCTQGPWQALVTFQQLLVLADQDGSVDMTAEAIARRTTIPIEIIQLGITELLKPDPKSRTPTEDGKRIVPLSPDRDWGWLVVNYKHYRQLKREVDRREYHREYWHKRKTQHTQPNQPIAEAYAEAKEKIGTAKRRHRLPDDFQINETGLQASKVAGIDTNAELQRFRDFHTGKGTVMVDWQAAWRTWVSNAVKFGGAKKIEPEKPKGPRYSDDGKMVWVDGTTEKPGYWAQRE